MASENQDRIDRLLRRKVYLLGYAKHITNRIFTYLDDTEPEMRLALLDIFGPRTGEPRLITRLRNAEARLFGIRSRGWNRSYQELLTLLFEPVAAEPELLGSPTKFDDGVVRNKVSKALIAGQTLKNWWKQLKEADIRRILSQLRVSVLGGEGLPDLLKRLTGKLSSVASAAKNSIAAIANTAVVAATGAMRKLVVEANGILYDWELWVSVLDSKTTITCFPGSVVPVPIGIPEKLFSRFYEGEVFVITTATGHQLRGTPNHPVLTSEGWLPLNKLKPGKHVVYSVIPQTSSVCGDVNVATPPCFTQLSNATLKPTVPKVVIAGSSATEFHGDGYLGKPEVCIADINCHLWDDVMPRCPQSVQDESLAGVSVTSSLSALDRVLFHLFGGSPVTQATQFDPGLFKSEVQPAFTTRLTQTTVDFNRTQTLSKKIQGKNSVSFKEFVTDTTGEGWSDAQILQEAHDSGGRSFVFPSDGSGGLTLPMTAENIVSVRSEFFSGQVYNLQTSTGFYIADSFIVHNCRDLAGQQFPVGQGPQPGYHLYCRSERIPVSDGGGEYNLGTYKEWASLQPLSFRRYAGTGEFSVKKLKPIDWVDVRDHEVADSRSRTP